MKEKSEVHIESRNNSEANAEEEAESVAVVGDLTSHPRKLGSQEEGSDSELRGDPDSGPDPAPTQSSLASALPPQHSINGLTTVDIHI